MATPAAQMEPVMMAKEGMDSYHMTWSEEGRRKKKNAGGRAEPKKGNLSMFFGSDDLV